MKKIMMRLAVPALALALGCGLFAGCAPEKTQEGDAVDGGRCFEDPDDRQQLFGRYEGYVWNIADSLGVEDIYLGNLYIGGARWIRTHSTQGEIIPLTIIA